jgi:adenylate cyclase
VADDAARRTYHGKDPKDYWRRLLSDESLGFRLGPRLFGRFPSAPRCKLCHAPFEGPSAPVFRALGFRRWALNAQICRFCISGIAKRPGGTEVDVSLLYADVRGSTTLAENMSPSEFTDSLNRFFRLAFDAVDGEDGLIDHIIGDGVMAMWIPGFVGADHPAKAVAAGRELASTLASSEELGDSFPAGVGVHTGVAYVGVVGEKGSYDFTVVGDVANTVARLGSVAQGGELVMSEAIADAAGVDTRSLQHRMYDLKGKEGRYPAWVESSW